ncbi:MAG: endonuclease MutS2 [Dissulfurispiraceae bacterium]|jgi:DNA mismatch repair protein MutS2|nr:endonuclease MutS2 [Dissulfurispiraceae bacterium]
MPTQNLYQLLEFDKLLNIASSYAKSSPGQKAINRLCPLDNLHEINKRFSIIEEIRLLSQRETPLQLSEFSDIMLLLNKIRPEGSILDPVELASMLEFLAAALDITTQIAQQPELQHLGELAESLTGQPELLKTLKRSIGTEGTILDTASAELSRLRSRLRTLESRIRRRLEDITKDERLSVFLQDDFVTQRSGRWVIPVRMDSKGQVPGVVHDISNTGETAFIEPLEIISISNELENAKAEHKTEELRILREISRHIRLLSDDLAVEHAILVQIDLFRSISLLADELGMQVPKVIKTQGRIRLASARHPLLIIAYKSRGSDRNVIPLDVELSDDKAVMVITGSNAGGKTIAIKTVGLLTLMALSGIPIPADSSSMIPMISNVLVDIGDEQSIEANQSTFSAHISNIAHILEKADENSLVLIDELGTGTDPSEGGALACALLKELRSRDALVFATTHLTDIKGFVHKTEGMINASMEFDRQTLSPLYRLRVGEPGQSHAIDTAARYGLPQHIIDDAKQMLGSAKVEIDSLISDLNAKRADYEQKLAETQFKMNDLSQKEAALAAKSRKTAEQTKEALARAYEDAAKIVHAAKQQMNSFIDEMKRSDRQKQKELMRHTEAEYKKLSEKAREHAPVKTPGVNIDELKPGQFVSLPYLKAEAIIQAVDTKTMRVRLSIGGKEIELPVTEITLTNKQPNTKTGNIVVDAETEASTNRINFVGFRVDDAIIELEPFLNHASMSGLSEVVIIHGIGTGALSRGIKEYLKGHPLIAELRPGKKDEGGAGVTIAILK